MQGRRLLVKTETVERFLEYMSRSGLGEKDSDEAR